LAKGESLLLDSVIISFKDWATDPHFYEKLIDGESKQETVFKRYKEKMDIKYSGRIS